MTWFTFDSQGRQLTRTLPSGVEAFEADANLEDRPVSLRFPAPDAQRLTFTEYFQYDDMGRQQLHISFEGIVTEFVYSTVTGRLLQKLFYTDLDAWATNHAAPAEVIDHGYDAFGRQSDITWTRADGSQDVWHNDYDDHGRLTRVVTPTGVVTYGYDALGRTVRTAASEVASPDTFTKVTRYEYDALGRLQTVEEDLDPSSALDPRLSTEYSYELTGNLDLIEQSNGVLTDYEYDALNRLDTLTHYRPDNTPDDLSDNPKLAEFDYEVLANGSRSGMTVAEPEVLRSW